MTLLAAARAPAPTVQDSPLALAASRSSPTGNSRSTRGNGGVSTTNPAATGFDHHLAAAEVNAALCTAAAVRAASNSRSDASIVGGSDGGSTRGWGGAACSTEDAMEIDDPGHGALRIAPQAEQGHNNAPPSTPDGRHGLNNQQQQEQQQQQQMGREHQQRWFWLQGRLADARKRPYEAKAAFEACRRLMTSPKHVAAIAAAADDVNASSFPAPHEAARSDHVSPSVLPYVLVCLI